MNAVAVDENGQPSFITLDNKIARKKDGKWIYMQECSTGVAVGPDGTLYRLDCDDLVNKYVDGKWVTLSDQKCSRMSIGEDGRVWIQSKDTGKIYGDMKTFALATGPDNTVLVTNAENDRVYTLHQGEWKLLGTQLAFEITVAKHGRIYLRDSLNRITSIMECEI